MSNKDLAQSVNAFMLSSAPTLSEASPMSYDMLKILARQLVFKVRTTKEHAQYVIGKKYGDIYVQAVIAEIVEEAAGDEMTERIASAKRRRELKRACTPQPRLLAV